MDDFEGGFARPGDRRSGHVPSQRAGDSRIAFLGVYQIRNLDVEREVRLVVLEVTSIACVD